MRSKKRIRRFPEFQYPAERGAERYALLSKLTLVAEKMKQFGVQLDLGRTKAAHETALERAGTFTSLFQAQTGLSSSDLGKAGIGATKAVKEWFKRQGAPDVVFDKKSGKSQFNAAALVSWSSDFKDQPFAEPAAALLGIRKSQVNARFALNYYRVASQNNGRIHFGFNVLGTKGLRWSASEKFSWYENGELQKVSLNAQNVPSKDVKYTFKDLGEVTLSESLRSCFVPAKGCVWIKFDFIGAEAGLIAYNTGDKLLLEWLKSGADLHTENAKIMFLEAKIPKELKKIEDGTPLSPCRLASKNLQFALSYQMPNGRGEDKYPESFKYFKERFPAANEQYFNVIVRRFYEAHTGIRNWQYGVCKAVEEKGYVQLPQTGSTLYVPNNSKGKNMSGNFFMQNGVGFLINRATPDVSELCDWEPDGNALLLQVHDELDLQARERDADHIQGQVQILLEQDADFGGIVAGLKAKGTRGESWNG